jgi:hypothetical protein
MVPTNKPTNFCILKSLTKNASKLGENCDEANCITTNITENVVVKSIRIDIKILATLLSACKFQFVYLKQRSKINGILETSKPSQKSGKQHLKGPRSSIGE